MDTQVIETGDVGKPLYEGVDYFFISSLEGILAALINHTHSSKPFILIKGKIRSRKMLVSRGILKFSI